MKLLVTCIKTNRGQDTLSCIRPEVIGMPNTYDMDADSKDGKFTELKSAFANQVVNITGFYDIERERWKDPMSFSVASISEIKQSRVQDSNISNSSNSTTDYFAALSNNHRSNS